MEYIRKKRTSRVVPFGYVVDPDDREYILPVKEELDALYQAYKYLRADCSYREVARWLSSTTGKVISFKNLFVKYKKHLKEKHGKRYPRPEAQEEV